MLPYIAYMDPMGYEIPLGNSGLVLDLFMLDPAKGRFSERMFPANHVSQKRAKSML